MTQNEKSKLLFVFANVKENRADKSQLTLHASTKEQRWLKKDVFSISERERGRETMLRLFIYTQLSIIMPVDDDAHLTLLHSQALLQISV